MNVGFDFIETRGFNPSYRWKNIFSPSDGIENLSVFKTEMFIKNDMGTDGLIYSCRLVRPGRIRDPPKLRHGRNGGGIRG